MIHTQNVLWMWLVVLLVYRVVSFSEHSSLAKSQLEYIGERLQNKVQALKALKSSLKPDSKVLKMLHR